MATSEDNKPIAIIGGGFAGTSMLVHTLLKIAADETLTAPVKVVMVERVPEQMHGGVAYSKGANYGHHNLNAGANSMDMFPGQKPPAGMPGFIDYIKMRAAENPEEMDALTNPPRQMVNDYLQYMLGLAIEKVGKKAEVEIAVKQATHLADDANGDCVITFSDGSTLKACHTILATGFQESVAPKFAKPVENNPRFMDQPYSGKANPFYDEVCKDHEGSTRTLIVGTGLTAMDIAARLINSGYKGEIVMMSRRGLMHTSFLPTEPEEYLAKGFMRGEPRPPDTLEFTKERPRFLEATTIPDLVTMIGSEFIDLSSRGYTGPEILGYWERFVPEVAEKFPKKDLAALFGTYEALITSTRVGVTPRTGMTVHDGIESGQIKIEIGAIKDISPDGPDKLVVTANPGTGELSIVKGQFNASVNRPEQESYDYVFSAMGNTSNYAVAPEEIRDPLWSSLLTEGKATPHWTKSGIEVAQDFSLVGKDGGSSSGISVIGVPIAGHMMVTAYPSPKNPAVIGGKLGPNALGAMTISSEVRMLLDQKYEEMTASYRPEKTDAPAQRKQKQLQVAL